MKIVSLNKNPEKYGFLSELEYRNKTFHGHQVALVIGIKNANGSWEKLCTTAATEQKKEKIADDMLNDKSLIILEDKITQFENNRLVPKTVYYLPYYVADHSAYQPTVNFEQISYACNVENNVKIEVLFVHEEGWYNRYVTFDLKTKGDISGRSLSLMDFIQDLEQYIEDSASENNGNFFIAENLEDCEDGDIALDFYDKAGQKVFVGGSVEYFLSLVSSIRIINIETKIIEEAK